MLYAMTAAIGGISIAVSTVLFGLSRSINRK